MSKQKQNKSRRSKPKDRQGGRATPKPARKQTHSLSRVVRSVCSITDPFCEAAVGAKYFDGTASRTLAYPLAGQFQMTTNSSGEAALLVIPAFLYPFAVGACSAGVATFTVATTGGGYALPAPSGFRINSWGLRIRNIVAPLSSSGIVSLRFYGNLDGTNLGTVNSALFGDQHADIPLQDTHDVAVVGKRQVDNFHLMRDPVWVQSSNQVSAWTSSGWSPFMIYLRGCPASTSCVLIDFVIHYELSFYDGDSMNLMTTPSPPINTAVTQASSIVYSSMNNIFSRGIASVENAVVKYAGQAVGSMIGGFLGGPAGAKAGRAAGLLTARMVD